MSSGLRKVRRRMFSTVFSIKQFENILQSDKNLNEKFGLFRGSPFYRKTVSVRQHEGVIFVIDQIHKVVDKAGEIMIDGTFKILPQGFMQLLVIFAQVEGTPRPLAFILMTSRKMVLYR